MLAQLRPNIVFIIIDDMGLKDMGCSGSTYYETPNIDTLAESGMNFENGYSSSPVCAPSRGAILTCEIRDLQSIQLYSIERQNLTIGCIQ